GPSTIRSRECDTSRSGTTRSLASGMLRPMGAVPQRRLTSLAASLTTSGRSRPPSRQPSVTSRHTWLRLGAERAEGEAVVAVGAVAEEGAVEAAPDDAVGFAVMARLS